MVFRHGYDIRQHAMYPGRYYIVKDGKQMATWATFAKKGGGYVKYKTRRMTPRQARRLLGLLIAEEDKKCL